MADMEIAKLITAARERAGLTKAELARRMAVTPVTVCRWEGSPPAQMPDWPHLRQLAAVLGCSIIELVPEGN